MRAPQSPHYCCKKAFENIPANRMEMKPKSAHLAETKEMHKTYLLFNINEITIRNKALKIAPENA